MKKFRYFLMMFLTVAACAGFQSCSDDEDEDVTFSDFYIECTNVSGGGLSSQDCASLRSSLNEDLAEISNSTKSEAISIFNQIMEGMARQLSSLHPEEPLKITFELKTKTKGQSVKRTTITIKNDGVTMS